MSRSRPKASAAWLDTLLKQFDEEIAAVAQMVTQLQQEAARQPAANARDTSSRTRARKKGHLDRKSR